MGSGGQNSPIGVVVHGHHRVTLDDTVLLWQILLCECLVVQISHASYFIPCGVQQRLKDQVRTMLSLESPIFLPMSSFIHLLVLSSPPLLDCMPGITRGMFWYRFVAVVESDVISVVYQVANGVFYEWEDGAFDKKIKRVL
jgi:hypothetical protein